MTRAEFEALIDAHGIACQTEAREQTRGSILAADATRAALLAAFPASAPPEASGLREAADDALAMLDSLRGTEPDCEGAVTAQAEELRAALAATPDARPDPRWEHSGDHYGRALTWIEENVPNGIVLVARALSECRRPDPGPSPAQATTPAETCPICDGPAGYTEVDGLRVPTCCAPASPQATTPAPSHDAKEITR